jgi:hypothetical protein
LQLLLWGGVFYHLYNQVRHGNRSSTAVNAVQRRHDVNVVARIVALLKLVARRPPDMPHWAPQGARLTPSHEHSHAHAPNQPLLRAPTYASYCIVLSFPQLSYMVLDQGISPVTFSVGNTMKRVAVVVSSVMFFRNPVAPLNWAGSFIAIAGTYLYSLATDKAAAEKKKAAAGAPPKQ